MDKLSSQINNFSNHIKKNIAIAKSAKINFKRSPFKSIGFLKKSIEALGLEIKSLKSINKQLKSSVKSNNNWKKDVKKQSQKIKTLFDNLRKKNKKSNLNEGVTDWVKGVLGKSKGLFDKAMVVMSSHPIASKLLITATIIVLIKSGGDVTELIQQLTSNPESVLDSLENIVDNPDSINVDSTADSFMNSPDSENIMNSLDSAVSNTEQLSLELSKYTEIMDGIDNKYNGSIGEFIEKKGYTADNIPSNIKSDLQKYFESTNKSFDLMSKIFQELNKPSEALSQFLSDNIITK